MRNGNDVPSVIRPEMHIGLKPTYEEWKPILPYKTNTSSVCLKPTYEEWKRDLWGGVGYKLFKFKAYL